MTSEEAILSERNHLRAKLASLTKERDDDFAVMTARALASEERAARFERILRATAAGLMSLDGRTYEGDALLEYMPAEALGQHKAWLAAEGRLTAAIAREANFAGIGPDAAARQRAEKRAALWKRAAKEYRESRNEWRDIADGMSVVGQAKFDAVMRGKRRDDLDENVAQWKVDAEARSLAIVIERLSPKWCAMAAVIAASRAMLAVDPWRGRGAEWEQMRSALAALDAEAGE